MQKIVWVSDGGDFFFTPEGLLLGGWQEGDAHWRHEYMAPLLRTLGFEVELLEGRKGKAWAKRANKELFGL